MDWSVKLGNAFEDPANQIIDSISSNKIYNMYSLNPPRLPSCKFCFTVSEIINLYFNNQIAIDDLKNIRLFNGKESLSVIENMKKHQQISMNS